MPRRPDSPSSSSATSCSSLFPAPHGQLTRARKLRHLQDSEVADLDFDSVKFSPRGGRAQVNTTASSVSLSVDINSDDCDSLRFSTAVPQPLPLPDLATLCQVSDPKNARNDAFRLLSPQDAKEGDRGRGKGGGRATRRVNNSEVTGHDAFYGPSPGERETGALCAMKEVELCPDDNKCIESMKQLEQEINVISHLKHPNIVQYYGSEIVDDKFYIYLEYVYPGSINKYVHEYCRAMTESVVRNFTRHILSGLAYLHSTKTIHRDIKGANLLVDAFGVVKLADFGMAKHLTGQVADLSFKGSPYWMAPELMQAVMQRDNSSDLALAVDIWSLGCTVIEMFTARPPWSEYEGVAAMFKVLKESPPIPETLSAEGKDFLRCCFQRNPAHRPSASMLLEHPFVRSVTHLDAPYHLPTCNES